MARKKESLSFKERVEKAIVPDWEQPYKVPENWVWTRLGETFEWSSGGTPSRRIPEYYTGTIPWIKTGELCDGYIYDTEEKITEEAIKKSSAKRLPINTVVIAMYGATIGKVAILGMEATTNQACACAKPNNIIDVKYFFYYAMSQKDYFIKKGKGGAQPNISQEIIKMHHFPLPPIAEQQRIVDRIESLFSKLDEAKEKAQTSLDSFENRKAVILHKAFTGELTQKWREENMVGLDSWEEKTLKDVCDFRAGYAFDSKRFSNDGHQVIRMGNLYNGVLDLERNPVFLPHEEIDEKTLNRARIKCGDILLTLTGTKYKRDYGYAVMIDIDGLLLNQRIVAMTPTKIKSRYLLFTLQSNYFRDIFFSNETGGVNQGNVSSKFVESIKIKYPTLPEQTEIVRILDSIFEKEKQAKELTNVIEKIDLMKKAILARAFRGVLGTNDPEEESAMELLREILEVKS